MPDKICYRCKKEFKTTQHYVRHLQRKYPCKVVGDNQNTSKNNDINLVSKSHQNVTNPEILKETKELEKEKEKKIKIYKCDACKATFNHRQNKYVHLKTCKKLKEKNDKNYQNLLLED